MAGRPVAPVALIACVAAAASCAVRRALSADARYEPPPALADGWPTASADDDHIDRARLEQMTDAILREAGWNVHAVLIEHSGHLVYERYFSGEDQRWGRPLGRVTFGRDVKHDLRSVSKSVVSALVGSAFASGAIRSLDAPILGYFPEYPDLQTPERRRITLRHALTMTAGLDWHEDIPYSDPGNSELVMTRSAEPLRFVLDRPLVTEPGATWNYSGGLTQLLAAVVERTTRTPLRDYAQKVLFEPLGITDVEWLGRLAGMPAAASGLRLRPRDLAKFGSLYLHQGQWNGAQVLPPAWVEESSRRHLTTGGRGSDGYGYQWWNACVATSAGRVEARVAVGLGSQRVYVLPALHTVVTMLSGRYTGRGPDPTRRILAEYVIPSLGTKPAEECRN